MPAFAVNRKEMNRGCGDTSGRWLFEEFMFADNVFGSAAVEYQFQYHRPDRRDDKLFGPGGNNGEVEIWEPVVKDVVVVDDDGNAIPLSDDAVRELEAIVLEAFEADKDNVVQFEMERR